jgi:hypothetical protein
MSFDSIFHGAPSSNGGQSVSGGAASLGIDVATGQIYFRTPSSGIWKPIPGGGSGGTVTSDQVTNESTVSGSTVTQALDVLENGSASSSGLDITTAGTASPTPVFLPNEAPSDENPSIYAQDINGAWHQQAGIDTTDVDPVNGPPAPAGTLTWYRRMYYRDTTSTTQEGKNAFMSINHTSGIGTVQTNQDRALWASMGNVSVDNIVDFLITDNVVTINIGLPYLSAPYVFVPGMQVIPSGFAVGTYLNGVVFTLLTVVQTGPSGVQLTMSASGFTHADVAPTSDTGSLDQKLYGMATFQGEMDIYGHPDVYGSPDGECSYLSFEVNDSTDSNFQNPLLGINAIRAQVFRNGSNQSSGTVGWCAVKALCTNANVADMNFLAMAGVYAQCSDESGGPAPHGIGYGVFVDQPATPFGLANYGLRIKGTGLTNGNDYAIYNDSGKSHFGGPVDFNPGYTVATLPSGSEGQQTYATDGRKVGEGSGSGTGVPVYFSNAQWRVYSTDAQVLA